MRSSRSASWKLLIAVLVVGPGGAQDSRPASRPQADSKPTPASRPEQRPADADALFERFRRIPGLEATYVEQKHIALLARPLSSTGRLYFLPPGHLVQQVAEPEAAKLTVTPDELRVEKRDDVEVMDLRQNEGVRQFITSLVRVFSGDRDGLEAAYSVEYVPSTESASEWVLTLVPRDKPLTDVLEALRLFGDGERVVRIEMADANGDRTVTTILTADPAREFDAEERKTLFGLDPGGDAR